MDDMRLAPSPSSLPRLARPGPVAALLGVLALIASALSLAAGHASAATVTLTVAKGGGEYTSVQAAVNAVPNNSSTLYTIQIGSGTYEEAVTIPAAKLHLTLLGATGNPANVVIDSARYNSEANPAGGTYGTEGSATVHVAASNFKAAYITFSNSFSKAKNPTVTGTQAVAIAMEGDRQVYEHDVFYGHQDTLLTWGSTATKSLRQYIYASTIEGDVDYIFGNGSLVVDRSSVVVLNDGFSTQAFLTAPATYGTDKYGILITGSTVTTTLAANQIYLGRAWVPYTGAVPQLVIRTTSLPSQVNTSNPYLGISGATWTAGRYFEYDNTGSGANPNKATRPQLTTAQAASYTAPTYLAGSDGWDPVAS
jgi:pectin methylesterase-like acyl-CoA thioesterase